MVKVGSRALVPGRPEAPRFETLAQQIARLLPGEDGRPRQVVLVSSGAIVLGREVLRTRVGVGGGGGGRGASMAELQAAAAVGQRRLMAGWSEAFAARHRETAQLLLTHADLGDRERFRNARNAVDALLDLGVVPVVNENDTVAVDEIRFGDNDQLAAMVANLVGADLLVLLTNVDGLLEGGAGGRRVPLVDADDPEVDRLVDPTAASDAGTGGMASKLAAARRAADRGIPVVIAPAARAGILGGLLAGEDLGTLVLPKGLPMASRKHWIAHTLRPQGSVFVDAGAAAALRAGKSLLPAGVVAVSGTFEPGDAVRVHALPDDQEIARGLTRYGLAEAARLAGAHSDRIPERIGRPGSPELIHRDDLVLLPGNR